MKRTLRLTKNYKDLLETFTELLPDSTKILYDKDRPYLTYQVVVDDDNNEATEVYKAALSLEKEPVEVQLKGNREQILATIFDIFYLVNQKTLFVSHILVHSIDDLGALIKKSAPNMILNTKVLECDDLAKDIIVFIASVNKQAEIEDFRLLIKGNVDI